MVSATAPRGSSIAASSAARNFFIMVSFLVGLIHETKDKALFMPRPSAKTDIFLSGDYPG